MRSGYRSGHCVETVPVKDWYSSGRDVLVGQQFIVLISLSNNNTTLIRKLKGMFLSCKAYTIYIYICFTKINY